VPFYCRLGFGTYERRTYGRRIYARRTYDQTAYNCHESQKDSVEAALPAALTLVSQESINGSFIAI
jgi:hypothetical protein